MKKEIVVAVAIGFVIGATFAFSITNLPKFMRGIRFQTSPKSPTPTPSEVKETPSNLDFTIYSPKNESVSDSKSIDITGSIKKGKAILIESLDDQIVLEASDSSRFSTKVNLREGVNTIYFTVFDESGNSNTKSLNIYYTSEKL